MALGLVWLAGLCPAQKPQEQNSIASFVAGFTSGSGTRKVESHLEDLQIDTVQKEVRVFADEIMAWYHFDRNRVEQTYEALRQLLPAERRDFKLKIYSKGQLLEDLVQGGWDHEEDRFWNKAEHRGNAWVTPLDRPYSVAKGLGGRHLSVTASHGRYYSIGDHKWQWQRPYLFCTTEDLLSQTFVVPYLIPMLENAGAVVYSTRERDWQKNEVIVDNDTPTQAGTYSEQQGTQAWETAGLGFAHLKVSQTGLCSCGQIGCLEANVSAWALSGNTETHLKDLWTRVEKETLQCMANAISMTVQITGSSKVVISGEGATITDYCLRELRKLCPGMEILRSNLGEKANTMAAAEIALDKWVYLTSMLEKMRSWL